MFDWKPSHPISGRVKCSVHCCHQQKVGRYLWLFSLHLLLLLLLSCTLNTELSHHISQLDKFVYERGLLRARAFHHSRVYKHQHRVCIDPDPDGWLYSASCLTLWAFQTLLPEEYYCRRTCTPPTVRLKLNFNHSKNAVWFLFLSYNWWVVDRLSTLCSHTVQYVWCLMHLSLLSPCAVYAVLHICKNASNILQRFSEGNRLEIMAIARSYHYSTTSQHLFF